MHYLVSLFYPISKKISSFFLTSQQTNTTDYFVLTVFYLHDLTLSLVNFI